MYGLNVAIFTYFLVSGRETLILWHWDNEWLRVFRELTDCQRTLGFGASQSINLLVSKKNFCRTHFSKAKAKFNRPTPISNMRN